MLNSYYDSLDYLFSALFGRVVLPSDFTPIDLSSIEYLERMGSTDFYFLINIGTADYGCVISESRLDEINSLVKVGIGHRN
jgi:hypothetical protein